MCERAARTASIRANNQLVNIEVRCVASRWPRDAPLTALSGSCCRGRHALSGTWLTISRLFFMQCYSPQHRKLELITASSFKV